MKNGLIVSIQGYSEITTLELASKSVKTGCVAIRTDENINLNCEKIALKKLDDRQYYITTTKEAIKSCMWGNYIAIDSRKGNKNLDFLYAYCHINEIDIVADIEDIRDFDNIMKMHKNQKIALPAYVSTTFSFLKTGKHDFLLVKELYNKTNIPIIAEGKIKTVEDVKKAYKFGAKNVCIGAEISDIEYLTKKFIVE
jgi:N-acylglucosamine-6-phosphate 2-epimerase